MLAALGSANLPALCGRAPARKRFASGNGDNGDAATAAANLSAAEAVDSVLTMASDCDMTESVLLMLAAAMANQSDTE